VGRLGSKQKPFIIQMTRAGTWVVYLIRVNVNFCPLLLGIP
jgi:hypothetical protein